MKIAVVTTNDFYSKIALDSLIEHSIIDYSVKINITKKYQFKIIKRGLQKSFMYILYLIFESLVIKKNQGRLLEKVNLLNKFDCEVDDINSKSFIDKLKENSIEVVLFVRPNIIVKKNFLEAFPESYNIHNTMLPKYRGLGGIFQTLKNNDKILGITIHKMNDKMDAGDIAIQKTICIKDKDSLFGLTYRSYKKSSIVLLDFVLKYKNGILELKKQDETLASTYSWPKLKDFYMFFKTGHCLFSIKDF
jgi:methionyl-tRNA formyltransferase